MNPKHVISEFRRAEKSLKAAQVLRDKGLFEDSISRSYYAVMHAAKSALLAHDVIAESHSAVRRLFGDVLVRRGLLEKDWASVFSEEQDQRVVADYDAEAQLDLEITVKLLEDAQAFVQRILDYLKGLGIALDG